MLARARWGGVLVAVALALSFAASGCGGTESEAGSNAAEGKARSGTAGEETRRGVDTVTPSHCPASLSSCRSAEGRIVYVERVDPDGDGDAHFVIRDPQGITLPGLTAIDVRKGLRPNPLPGPGDLISAAGPVQTGSYGQDQIHVLELHVGG